MKAAGWVEIFIRLLANLLSIELLTTVIELC